MSRNQNKTDAYKPDQAFILAAGKGTRLRPYTDNTPKPMVRVDGKPILEHILDKLKEVDVKTVTINLFYLGEKIKSHFKSYTNPTITFSEEEELLETGGGVKKAIHTMQGKPFYLINGDALWSNDNVPALQQLSDAWNPDVMDMLLLLQPTDPNTVSKNSGDYQMSDDGALTRTPDGSGSYMFTGIRITKPNVVEGMPEGAFSFLECMDKAQNQGRLYGIVYDGTWHHISTPQDLDEVNAIFSAQKLSQAEAS